MRFSIHNRLTPGAYTATVAYEDVEQERRLAALRGQHRCHERVRLDMLRRLEGYPRRSMRPEEYRWSISDPVARLSYIDGCFARIDARDFIRHALPILAQNERQAVCAVLWGLTGREYAAMRGVTESRISQVYQAAVRKMKGLAQ